MHEEISALLLALALCAVVGCRGSHDLPDAVSDAEAADIGPQSCPGNLVLWEEYNVCAPRVDECENPWELPLIGGGCVAIGPRACPKLWDPESEVDCEPGELMTYNGSACPEGFVLTEDEVACIPFFEENCGEMEIPVLGGGCKKVGPDWGEEGEPHFDDCEPGHLALPGGGCVLVGPRACPKLWDPEADVDCKIGDVLPCKEGWVESEDGLYCEPVYDECPFGERPILGGGCQRVIPLAKDCPPGPFPEVPEGATDVAYVLAESDCTENCGSQEAPYSSIQAAVDTVPEGGDVLIGLGTYAEGLLVDKTVSIRGLCASLTVLTGAVQMPQSMNALGSAGVAVIGAKGVQLEGLGISSPAVGLAIIDSDNLDLHNVELAGVVGIGLYIGKSAAVTADSVWLHDTIPAVDSSSLEGYGIWVENGGSLDVKETLIESARGAGILVRDAGTQLEMADSAVRNTQATDNGKLGFGLNLSHSGSALMNRVLFENNRNVSLYVSNVGTQLDMWGTVIRKSKPGPAGQFGWGMQLSEGATAVVSDCLFNGNQEISIIAAHTGTELMVSSTIFSDTVPSTGAGVGHGLQMIEGTAVEMSGCLFQGNAQAAIVGSGDATHLDVSGSLVRNTVPVSSGDLGQGLQLNSGASAAVSNCSFEGNTETGVVVADAGTELVMTGSVVRDTRPNASDGLGCGVQVGNGSWTTISNSVLERNTAAGAIAVQPGTTLELQTSLVRDTQSDPSGLGGEGLRVGDQASATVSQCVFETNRGVGIGVGLKGTTLKAVSSVIRSTAAHENGEAGWGLHVGNGAFAQVSSSDIADNAGAGIVLGSGEPELFMWDSVVRGTPGSSVQGPGLQLGEQAVATVSGCLFDGNVDVGVAVHHAGTRLELADSAIANTMANSNGEHGHGLGVVEGASAGAKRCLFVGNTDLGIAVDGDGAVTDLADSEVRGTSQDENGDFGWAMQASGGALATVSGCLVDSNHDLGLAAFESGSELHLSRSVVRNTLPDASGETGRGGQIGYGASATVAGCLFVDNVDGAIIANASGTFLQVLDSIVEGTKKNVDGRHGIGIIGISGARIVVDRSRLKENATAGLMVDDPGTEGSASQCLIESTFAGGGVPGQTEQAYGDGVVASDGALLVLKAAIIAGNSRSGAYYHDSEGRLSGCVVVGNGSYGLAMADCHERVEYGIDGAQEAVSTNHIVGNAHMLDSGDALQVTTSPGEMPVPDPPEMAELPQVSGYDTEDR